MHLVMERWHAQSKAAFEGGSFETLWRIFESMAQKLYRRNIYYAIDAFDKCEEAHWRKQLLAQVRSRFAPLTSQKA